MAADSHVYGAGLEQIWDAAKGIASAITSDADSAAVYTKPYFDAEEAEDVSPAQDVSENYQYSSLPEQTTAPVEEEIESNASRRFAAMQKMNDLRAKQETEDFYRCS